MGAFPSLRLFIKTYGFRFFPTAFSPAPMFLIASLGVLPQSSCKAPLASSRLHMYILERCHEV